MANDLITHLVTAAPECPDCFGSLILADELVTKELHFQLHVSIVTTEFAKSPGLRYLMESLNLAVTISYSLQII